MFQIFVEESVYTNIIYKFNKPILNNVLGWYKFKKCRVSLVYWNENWNFFLSFNLEIKML